MASHSADSQNWKGGAVLIGFAPLSDEDLLAIIFIISSGSSSTPYFQPISIDEWGLGVCWRVSYLVS